MRALFGKKPKGAGKAGTANLFSKRKPGEASLAARALKSFVNLFKKKKKKEPEEPKPKELKPKELKPEEPKPEEPESEEPEPEYSVPPNIESLFIQTTRSPRSPSSPRSPRSPRSPHANSDIFEKYKESAGNSIN